MTFASPQGTCENHNQCQQPRHNRGLGILGIILLCVVFLWMGLVAFGVIDVNSIQGIPERTTRVLSTGQPVSATGTEKAALTLTLFHTNDTLGYVDPCA